MVQVNGGTAGLGKCNLSEIGSVNLKYIGNLQNGGVRYSMKCDGDPNNHRVRASVKGAPGAPPSEDPLSLFVNNDYSSLEVILVDKRTHKKAILYTTPGTVFTHRLDANGDREPFIEAGSELNLRLEGSDTPFYFYPQLSMIDDEGEGSRRISFSLHVETPPDCSSREVHKLMTLLPWV